MSHYEISDQDGQLLVRTARKMVTNFVNTGIKAELDDQVKSRFSFDAGVFVTITKHEELRGCIGYVLPTKLNKALPDAAISAATADPRFAPLHPSELDQVTFEVTILTPPKLIKTDDPQQIPSKIKVGRDGLIIKKGVYSGLLLPQVPKEYGWNEIEFLDHTCQKAGLWEGCWKDKDTLVYTFEGIIFREQTPGGAVARVTL